jgi:hypothetical protein
MINTKPAGKNVGYKSKKATNPTKDPYLAKAEAIGETRMAMADNTQRTVEDLESGKQKFMQEVVAKNGPPRTDGGDFKRYIPNA